MLFPFRFLSAAVLAQPTITQIKKVIGLVHDRERLSAEWACQDHPLCAWSCLPDEASGIGHVYKAHWNSRPPAVAQNLHLSNIANLMFIQEPVKVVGIV